MDRVLKNKDNIMEIFKNSCFSSLELEQYLASNSPNEIINNLLFLINNVVKEDNSINYRDSIINILTYTQSLLDLYSDINKKAIYRKIRKIVESMNTYLLESKFNLYPKNNYISFFDDLMLYLDELTSDKNKNDNLILFNLIYKVRNIEYINISLNILNITSEPLTDGESLLRNLLNTYIERLNAIDYNLDDVRYYDSIIKMLYSNQKIQFDSDDKKDCLSFLKRLNGNLKKQKALTKEKNKYLSSLIEYFEDAVNEEKHVNELANRHFVTLDLDTNNYFETLNINPHSSSRVLSNDYIISIDNKNTSEIDDCLSCTKLDNGNYLLGIHITDLFGILNIDSDVISDAYKHVSTIYADDLFIPMLPMNIAIDKASLIENKLRYADSHYYEITKNGEILSDKIMSTIITNNRKLSYDDVNRIIREDKCRNEELLNTIRNLRELKQILIGKFNTDFTYLNDKQDTTASSYNKAGNSEAEQIVLYTMLLENSNMAEYFYQNNYPLIYRVHSINQDHELERKTILDSLNMDRSKAALRLADLIIKTKPQSTYSLCGSHEGLGISHYCHSTSPERRFADLWNRYLIKCCRMSNYKDTEIYKLEKYTQEIVEHINEQLPHINSFIVDYNNYKKLLKKNR